MLLGGGLGGHDRAALQQQQEELAKRKRDAEFALHQKQKELANQKREAELCARELAAWTGTAGDYEAANAGEVEGEPVDEFAS